jgi:hypothetical protein
LAIKTLDLEPDPDLGIHNTATSLFCFMPCAGREDAVVAMEEGGSGSFTIPMLSSQLETKNFLINVSSTKLVPYKANANGFSLNFFKLVVLNVRFLLNSKTQDIMPSQRVFLEIEIFAAMTELRALDHRN